VAVIWLLHPWLGMLALASAVLLFSLALANELAMRGPLGEAGELWVEAQRRSETALRNGEVVQAMGMLPPLRGAGRRTTSARSPNMSGRATGAARSPARRNPCGCSFRSRPWASAPIWCCKGS
jgi:ABC-type protease/lipase transport system fused ATPase/permease subunit